MKQRIITKMAGFTLLALLLTNCAEEAEMKSPVTTSPVSKQASLATSRVQTYDCRNILIDASHDGGVWWYPQEGTFNPNLDHQGKRLADVMRNRGFHVDELGRGEEVTSSLLKNYVAVFRMNGFGKYTESELSAYAHALDRGMSLFLFADHTKYNPNDGLAEMLDVHFDGAVDGTITKYEKHPLVNGVGDLKYMVGAVIVNTSANAKIKPLGWLHDGSPVMAIVEHPTSRIFVMGDVNTIEFIPSALEENILSWVGSSCNF